MLICGGLYVNHQLDRLATALSRPGLLFASPEEDTFPLPENAPAPTAPDTEAHRPGNDDTGSAPGPSTPPPDTAPGDQTAGGQSDREIAAAVQEKLDRPLEKKDLLKAGLIILRKLDKEEINYLYRVGTQDSCTREELRRVREILLGKLSPQEISTLKEIGAKYGKQLRILDPDVQLQ